MKTIHILIGCVI